MPARHPPHHRLVPASPRGSDFRRRKSRSLHTLALVAASLTGTAQFAGAQSTADISLLTYDWAGTRMAAMRAGAPDGRRVIFIHGTPGSSGAWEDYLAAVPDGFEYVAVDRAGFGASGPAQAVTSLEDQAEAIVPLVIEARDRGSVIIVGHSLGGPVAAMLGVLEPESIGAIVIVAGSLDPALEEIHFMQPIGEWWGVRHVLPRTIRNANRELLALEDELRSLAPRLEDLEGPIEIVHGTDDNLTPFENVVFMETQMRNADVAITVLEGQNHFLPWNAKPEIDAAIRRAADRSKTADLSP